MGQGSACQSLWEETVLTATGRAQHCAEALAAANLMSSLRKHQSASLGALDGTLLVSEQKNVFAP
jgi:hypothetical protein